MQALKLLLICAIVLSIACLVLAVFHLVHLRRDLKDGSRSISSQRPLWLEFPRAYTSQGRRHQRKFFVYLGVFVVLVIVLLVYDGTMP